MLDTHPHDGQHKVETLPKRTDPPPRASKARSVTIIAVLVAIAIAITGILLRRHDESEVTKWTMEQAVPVVATVTPKQGVSGQQIVLPGDIEAWFAAPIYARVSGYLKAWYFDFGAHVKKGQLLAEIDAPDLDAQLAAAKAKLVSAQAQVNVRDAERKFADTTYTRWRDSPKGVVPARNTDVGALINAGSGVGGGTGPQLFRVADVHEMRVFVQVPQEMSAGMHAGLTANLVLPQYPDKTFKAVVATTAEAINKTSRTLLVELHADNTDNLLQPGTFAQVSFNMADSPGALRIPTSA